MESQKDASPGDSNESDEKPISELKLKAEERHGHCYW